MDPKVCGKLLTHHRRGYGVDVKPSVIDSPSGRTPEKDPRWDLTGTEGCSDGNRVFVDASHDLGIFGNIYRMKN